MLDHTDNDSCDDIVNDNDCFTGAYSLTHLPVNQYETCVDVKSSENVIVMHDKTESKKGYPVFKECFL